MSNLDFTKTGSMDQVTGRVSVLRFSRNTELLIKNKVRADEKGKENYDTLNNLVLVVQI